MMARSARSWDTVVIGAGAAGLAAARDLSRAGYRVAVVEARGRTGGRINTHRDPASEIPIELGAEFVHGEQRVTFDIVRAAGLLAAELPDAHYRAKNGGLSPLKGFWEAVDGMSRDLQKRIARARAADFPVSRYLEAASLPPERRAMLSSFVEGFHAANPERLSARALAGANETGDHRQFRILSGSDALIRWLRDGLDPDRSELRLGTVARHVRWEPGRVVLDCSNAVGATLPPIEGRALVVTIPHAVWRANMLRFTPSLPDKQRAVQRLETGNVCKIALRFRHAFWEEDGFLRGRLNGTGDGAAPLAFVQAYEMDVPTWWAALPARAPVLTGWAGGPRADALYALDPEARLEVFLASLGRALTVPRTLIDDLLDSWATHDWRSDPFSRGAYAYVTVGGARAPATLARPVRHTLFFAGEATQAEGIGTVAGALESGKRAAREVSRALER